MNKNVLFLISLIGLAALTRLLPHPPNFTAVTAIGLFGGALFTQKLLRYLIPLAAIFVSDIFLNNLVYSSFNDGFTLFNAYALWVYIPIILLSFVAPYLIKKVNVKNVVVASVAGSAIFYLISNFGAFLVDPVYVKNGAGLVSAYVAGLPFFMNTLISALFFSGILFGSYAWYQKSVSVSEVKAD